jgi:hypothetical protein
MPAGRGTPEDIAKELIKAKKEINSEESFDDIDKTEAFFGTVEVVKQSVDEDYGVDWSGGGHYK